MDELQGYPTGKQAIRAFCKPHTAHSTVPQQGQYAVGAELLAYHARDGFGCGFQLARELPLVLQKPRRIGGCLGGKQVADHGRRLWIADLQGGQPGIPLGARHIQ